MIIHYNNGEKQTLIEDVIDVEIVDGELPVIAVLRSGKELTISLDHIECILDDDVRRKIK